MSGITYDYMEEYIRGLIPESEGRLKALEDFAKENGVPIAQKETIKFLEFMVSMKKPLRILELGTAIGYSAIKGFVSEALSSPTNNDPSMICPSNGPSAFTDNPKQLKIEIIQIVNIIFNPLLYFKISSLSQIEISHYI